MKSNTPAMKPKILFLLEKPPIVRKESEYDFYPYRLNGFSFFLLYKLTIKWRAKTAK